MSGLLLTGCATGTTMAGGATEVPAYMVPVVQTTTVSRAADCDRACLEGMVDAYFAAVMADDPSMAPLSPNVRRCSPNRLKCNLAASPAQSPFTSP